MKIFILGILLFLYFSIHSILANDKVKTYLKNRFISNRYYRLFFNFFSVVSLIPIFLFYKTIESEILFVNVLLSNIGLGLIIIGFLLSLVALNQYNLSEFTGTQQLNQKTPSPEKLKTSGFNAIVRHPLYFSMLLIIWGFFLSRPTNLFLMVSIIGTAYLYFGTKLEEEKLVKKFGDEYLKYQKEVGMLIPFLKF